jgi:hypothetical protein
MVDPTKQVVQADRQVTLPFRALLFAIPTEARWMSGEFDHHWIIQAAAAHRIQAEADAAAKVEVLEAENAVLRDRGARAVIAYHVAICSPKGVVPDDEFYDPAIASSVERHVDAARAALTKVAEGGQP